MLAAERTRHTMFEPLKAQLPTDWRMVSSGTAYLIHQEGELRFHFIDVAVNNGGSYRVAKVRAIP